MRLLSSLLLLSAAPLLAITATAQSPAGERLGKESFPTSCAVSQAAAINRGVALLHDFWYDEAGREFARIAKADPSCAMAYWGEAMSEFHQIWAQPDEAERAKGWKELQKARTEKLTAREKAYIDALTVFYKPDNKTYQQRIDAYSDAMAKVYAHYPDDIDAGAFYALSILARTGPNDTSLKDNREAMKVLAPLFKKEPDNPGVDHYMIHACDTPALAQQGLAAAENYSKIAPSGSHAVHMPGHIFARLGMWDADIRDNEMSVTDSVQAQANHTGEVHDQLHSQDFLLYAYLQTGQDAKAKNIVTSTAAMMHEHAGMGGMSTHGNGGLFEYYETELPTIYVLETRDWKAAAALEPVHGASPENRIETYWARAIAAGHLRDAAKAKQQQADFAAAVDELRKGKRPERAGATSVQIVHDEIDGWAAFAENKPEEALAAMRRAADLQDKVGQGEVDIPAREMLADMLLELHQPKAALAEYERALVLSPNRFNGLYHAGMAAEAAGDKTKAASYYATLLKQTGGGANSQRPELAHAKQVATATQVAARSM
jgi:tetratricopeptide (TPR) repeat protein